MVSHIYLANPQARIGGISQLNFASLTELQAKGLTGTGAFKTSGTYGTQFIVVGPSSLLLLEHWVTYFRPLLVKPHSGNYLFLNSNGRQHMKLGHCVTSFFKPFGYHITTTTLRCVYIFVLLFNFSPCHDRRDARCMQQTEARVAYRQNLLTKELDDAVTNHQGHSGITARLHYQKDLMEDAALGT